jgi:phage terminase large subunit-like protein
MEEGIYLIDPALAAKDQLGIDLDSWQKDVITTLFRGEKKRVSVRAGHGVGKSFAAAVITQIFLNNYPGSRVLITGPTSRQTRLQIWGYQNQVWQTNFLKDKIEWLKTKMYIKGYEESWFAAWVTSKNPKNAEGFHGENLLWIVEEAKTVQDAVFEGIQGALSQTNNFIYISSTCSVPHGYFYETHTSRTDMWDTFHIPSWRSPRVAPERIESWRKEWGEDNPIFQARVAAEFPDEDSHVIVPLSHLLRAVENRSDDEDLDAAA